MPTNKERNTFYWTICEVSSLLMKFGQFISYYKRQNFVKKINKNCDCVYFPIYLVKCVSCFMLGHLMTPLHLNIWKVKIWFSQEGKELSKWNKKYFSLFHKCSPLHLQKNSKNVAEISFIEAINFFYMTVFSPLTIL